MPLESVESALFLDSTTHLCKRLSLSIGQSVSLLVCLFVSNNEKHHVLYSNDDEISHGPRESWRQFKNDIKMSVHWSVCTSGWEKNDKMNKKCRQSSCILWTPRFVSLLFFLLFFSFLFFSFLFLFFFLFFPFFSFLFFFFFFLFFFFFFFSLILPRLLYFSSFFSSSFASSVFVFFLSFTLSLSSFFSHSISSWSFSLLFLCWLSCDKICFLKANFP